MHHEQNMRNMGGLKSKLKITFATMLIGTIAIAGLPPFSGFFSKDEILAHTFEYSKVLWAVGLLTAFLTSFYMFRMMFLTFFGKYRGTHHAEEHLHESPANMTMPLIVLAVLAAIGGLINVPAVFGGNEWLAHWLTGANVAQHHLSLDHATEYALMAASVLAAVTALVYAYVKYVKNAHVPMPDESKRGFLANISFHKFYLDEIYDALFRKPLDLISRFFYKVVDKKIIDGLVNGFGWSAAEGSKSLRLLQSGNVGFYIFMMVFAIIALLLYTYLSIA
jgi:NADH-quinone oxidoreductase subunit L